MAHVPEPPPGWDDQFGPDPEPHDNVVDWEGRVEARREAKRKSNTSTDDNSHKQDEPDPPKRNGTKQVPKPYPFALARDLLPTLMNTEIVKGLIPRYAFGEVHADSSAGKTAIMVDLLLHVAAGLDYRERKVQKQPVVYVALEGHAGIENRVIAARDKIGIKGDVPFALVKIGDDFRNILPAMRTAATAMELQARFGGECPIVAIDTYAAALGGGSSDCDPKDVTNFISNLQNCLLKKCTVIILHHFGKDSSRGSRGWSGLRAALDFEIEINVARDGTRTMRLTKNRDGSDQLPALCYRFAARELGINDCGDPVTAVVVEHLADQDDTNRTRRCKRVTRRRAPRSRCFGTASLTARDHSRSMTTPCPTGVTAGACCWKTGRGRASSPA